VAGELNPSVRVVGEVDPAPLAPWQLRAGRQDMELEISEVAQDTPCRMCGAGVPAGGPDDGHWRHHEACTPEALTIARAVVGKRTRLSAQDAQLLWDAGLLPSPAVARQPNDPLGRLVDPLGREVPGPTFTRGGKPAATPWSWIDTAQRREAARNLLDQLPALRRQAAAAASGRVACQDGPCGFCGRVEAAWWLRWHGKTWPGGAPCALCDQCSIWQHKATYLDDGWVSPSTRRAVLAAATGIACDDPIDVPAWAQHHDRHDEPPAGPWGHLDPDVLWELRVELRLRHRESDPGDMVDAVAAERAERLSKARARASQRAQLEPEPPRIWVFDAVGARA
jgi:hypothetical protein